MRTFKLKKRIIFCLLMCLIGTFWLKTEAKKVWQNPSAKYRIKITEETPKFVLVEARIPVSEGHLFMNPFGADDQPNGWATFVQNLEIRDEKGQLLSARADQNASWRIAVAVARHNLYALSHA